MARSGPVHGDVLHPEAGLLDLLRVRHPQGQAGRLPISPDEKVVVAPPRASPLDPVPVVVRGRLDAGRGADPAHLCWCRRSGWDEPIRLAFLRPPAGAGPGPELPGEAAGRAERPEAVRQEREDAREEDHKERPGDCRPSDAAQLHAHEVDDVEDPAAPEPQAACLVAVREEALPLASSSKVDEPGVEAARELAHASRA